MGFALRHLPPMGGKDYTRRWIKYPVVPDLAIGELIRNHHFTGIGSYHSPSASASSASRSRIRIDRPSIIRILALLIFRIARDSASGVAPRILASSRWVIVNTSRFGPFAPS